MFHNDLEGLLDEFTIEELTAALSSLPEQVAEVLLTETRLPDENLPPTPLAQAQEIEPTYVSLPHLDYLSDDLAEAFRRVEAGENQYRIVSMPPRSGKSRLLSVFFPVWALRKRPGCKIGLISHSPGLAASWGREVRRIVESQPELGLTLAKDAGAVTDWETTDKSEVHSRSTPGQSATGLGFNILIVDDPVKDYPSAHNEKARDALWEWLQTNAITRMEAPYLIILVGTRWHEDDLLGRVADSKHNPLSHLWKVIKFPAIATEADEIGRQPGDPLYSPVIRGETREQALERWQQTRLAVGSYTWAGLYQQEPAPAKGEIVNVDDLRYWTTRPELVTDDGFCVLLDPLALQDAQWADSWDANFGTAGAGGSFVVGQRWAKLLNDERWLIEQVRGRWTFTETLDRLELFGLRNDPIRSPFGQHVFTRLVEAKANGPAIMDVLKKKVTGMKPIHPRTSKEARLRSVTPEIESHLVRIPHPEEKPWVADFVSELRNFPHADNDDQVDTLSQALSYLKDAGEALVTVPSLVPTARRNTSPRAQLQRAGGAPAYRRR